MKTAKKKTTAAAKASWEDSWRKLAEEEGGFYTLMKRRYVWPYEGFIVNAARLLRGGSVSLDWTRILDFGCGMGRHAVFFARSGFRHVSGIDISEEAIQVARAWSRHEGFEIDFRSYDGAKLPYADGSFDLVCCFGTFHHIPPEGQVPVAREVSRVVPSGGHFLWAEDGVRTTRIPPGPRVGPNSYRIDDPGHPEHGLMQHLFTLQACRALFPEFTFRVGATEFLEGEGLDCGTSLWNLCGRKA